MCDMIFLSYQGTSEKIIMNQTQLKTMCQNKIDNMIDRMHDLCAAGRVEDASALYSEIQEWIIQKDDIEVMSIDYLNEVL